MYLKPNAYFLPVSELSMAIPEKTHLMVSMEVRMRKQLRRKYDSFFQKVSYT